MYLLSELKKISFPEEVERCGSSLLKKEDIIYSALRIVV